MRHLEISRQSFIDVNGIPRIIKSVSADKTIDLRILYTLFWKEIGKIDPTFRINFFEACEKNYIISNIATEIVKLCGINPDWIDFALLGALVHSYEDENGNHRGFLAESHFSFNNDPAPKNEPSEKDISFEKYYIKLLTTLATLQQNDYLKAKEIMETQPLSEVEAYLTELGERKEKQEKDPENKLSKLQAAKKKWAHKFNRSSEQPNG